MAKKTPKEFKPGQFIRVKLSGGRIEEARINHVLQDQDGTKLQVDLATMRPRSSSFDRFLRTKGTTVDIPQLLFSTS